MLGWRAPTFGHGCVPKVNHGSLQPNQGNRASDCSASCPRTLRDLIRKTDEANFPLGQIVLISSGIGEQRVNVSFLRGKNGEWRHLDFQFNPGPTVSQLATLQILNFTTDGALGAGPSLIGAVRASNSRQQAKYLAELHRLRSPPGP
jgi:hypothetical protein